MDLVGENVSDPSATPVGPPPEERALLGAIESARAAKDWETAFRELQRLLSAVRSRKDAPAIRSALDLFARVQAESGDPAAAGRTRDYANGRFR